MRAGGEIQSTARAASVQNGSGRVMLSRQALW
jgi:hypothetical protein